MPASKKKTGKGIIWHLLFLNGVDSGGVRQLYSIVAVFIIILYYFYRRSFWLLMFVVCNAFYHR